VIYLLPCLPSVPSVLGLPVCLLHRCLTAVYVPFFILPRLYRARYRYLPFYTIPLPYTPTFVPLTAMTRTFHLLFTVFFFATAFTALLPAVTFSILPLPFVVRWVTVPHSLHHVCCSCFLLAVLPAFPCLYFPLFTVVLDCHLCTAFCACYLPPRRAYPDCGCMRLVLYAAARRCWCRRCGAPAYRLKRTSNYLWSPLYTHRLDHPLHTTCSCRLCRVVPSFLFQLFRLHCYPTLYTTHPSSTRHTLLPCPCGWITYTTPRAAPYTYHAPTRGLWPSTFIPAFLVLTFTWFDCCVLFHLFHSLLPLRTCRWFRPFTCVCRCRLALKVASYPRDAPPPLLPLPFVPCLPVVLFPPTHAPYRPPLLR